MPPYTRDAQRADLHISRIGDHKQIRPEHPKKGQTAYLVKTNAPHFARRNLARPVELRHPFDAIVDGVDERP